MAASVEPLVFRVPATVHGRSLVLPAAAGAPLLLGFHGYGEAAEDCLRELRAVPGSDAWHLCAVEALHPFYRGRSEEVVASWMTRQDRELAIADNVAYVRAVAARLRVELVAEGPVVCAGFSQGVAMAWRAARSLGGAAAVFALAGDVPPELTAEELGRVGRAILARGDREEWYGEEKFAADLQRLRAAGVATETLVFRGGHEWTEEVREALAELLRGVSGGRPETAAPTE